MGISSKPSFPLSPDLYYILPTKFSPWPHGSFSLLFSCSVLSIFLWPHGLQHARLPCPSPSPGAYLNLCPLSCWCHLTISSFVVPFSSCLLSFPASGSFPMNQLFATGGQSIGTSALASVLPMNIQDWFPLGLTGLISLQSKGLSRAFSNSTVWKHNSSGPTLTSILDYWKTIALTRGSFVRKVMSLLLNTLSGIAIAFLPRSKHLLIPWLQSLSSVILEPKKIKSFTVYIFSPIYLLWSDWTRCQDLRSLSSCLELPHTPQVS